MVMTAVRGRAAADLSHLTPTAQAAAGLPDAQRRARIRAERWIGYSRAREALATLEDLLTHPVRQRMPNLLLIGPTNNGKSMLIEKFRRAHGVEPVPSAEAETIPVVTLQMPSEPSVSRFYMLLLTTSGYDLDAELEQARNLISRGVDGLVLRGDCHHDALRKMLADNSVPFINVGIYRPDRPYPCVGTDNEAAAYRAAAHVIELGHVRIGVVSALQRNNDRASARVAGFRRAFAENDIEQRAEWHVEVPYTLDDAREAARYLLNLKDRPTAVVCGNDVIAYGVLLEAERSGFSVPRDLSVVGFDDLDWSRHLRPSLTTIHVPTGETWQRAGEYLVRRLAGEQTIMHHEVDYSLVVRESTAPPPKRHGRSR